MAQVQMYEGQVNSPTTTLASPIDSDDTSIIVADGSILPTAPNLLTIGTDEDAETVLMTEKVGNVLTVTRAIEGTAISWDVGESIGRMFTAYDYNALKSNVEDLEINKAKSETLITTLDANWTGTEAPYIKTHTVTGITADDNPIIDVVMSDIFATDKELSNEWVKIYRITTASNSITLYAIDKPMVSLQIQLKVVR